MNEENDDIYEIEIVDEPWHAVVIGSTGKTGRYIVNNLLNMEVCGKVTVICRNELSEEDIYQYFINVDNNNDTNNNNNDDDDNNNNSNNDNNKRRDNNDKRSKLNVLPIVFEELDRFKNEFSHFSRAFCCLGTRTSKNIEYETVDYGYCSQIAKFLKKGNTEHLSLISCDEANTRSWRSFRYWKGKLEEYCINLNFKRLSIFRPCSLYDLNVNTSVFDKLRYNTRLFVDTVRPNTMSSIDVKQLANVMTINAERMKSNRIEIYTNVDILTCDVGRKVETMTVHLGDDENDTIIEDHKNDKPKITRLCTNVFARFSSVQNKSSEPPKLHQPTFTDEGQSGDGGGEYDDLSPPPPLDDYYATNDVLF